MGVRWFLQSACHLLGNPYEQNVDGDVKNIKASNGGLCLQMETKAYGEKCVSEFQMPLHYPRYNKADYEKMEEWKLDLLLNQYGLSFLGNLDEKRAYAMGAFLWPSQY